VGLEQNIEINNREALILKYLHHCIDKFILSLIGRSFTVLTDTEPIIKKELSYLPRNFTAAVAVEKKAPSIILKKENDEFKYYGYHYEAENIDLRLYFKDEEFAYEVLGAKEGIRQAFSEHKILLEGNLEYAVSMIYIFEIVEAYIMSDKFSKKTLDYYFKRNISRLKLILRALFLYREKGEI
jgi:hypothetical protein